MPLSQGNLSQLKLLHVLNKDQRSSSLGLRISVNPKMVQYNCDMVGDIRWARAFSANGYM